MPVNVTRVMVVEFDLHNYGPNVHPNIEDDDCKETDLGPAALTETLHVKNKSKTKAAHTDRNDVS